MKIQKVAVGIVVDANQKVLISKRPAHKMKGGFWEFPGGKIETNETAEQGLIRELQEEVGIEVQSCQKLMEYPYNYAELNTLLEVFIVTKFKGPAVSLEGQEIQWITVAQFSNYRFLEANEKIIECYLKTI